MMEATGAIEAASREGSALLEAARRQLAEWPASSARQGMQGLIDSFEEGLKS
jgi:hypothetical protein